jgi:hypothetical protein
MITIGTTIVESSLLKPLSGVVGYHCLDHLSVDLQHDVCRWSPGVCGVVPALNCPAEMTRFTDERGILLSASRNRKCSAVLNMGVSRCKGGLLLWLNPVARIKGWRVPFDTSGNSYVLASEIDASDAHADSSPGFWWQQVHFAFRMVTHPVFPLVASYSRESFLGDICNTLVIECEEA